MQLCSSSMDSYWIPAISSLKLSAQTSKCTQLIKNTAQRRAQNFCFFMENPLSVRLVRYFTPFGVPCLHHTRFDSKKQVDFDIKLFFVKKGQLSLSSLEHMRIITLL